MVYTTLLLFFSMATLGHEYQARSCLQCPISMQQIFGFLPSTSKFHRGSGRRRLSSLKPRGVDDVALLWSGLQMNRSHYGGLSVHPCITSIRILLYINGIPFGIAVCVNKTLLVKDFLWGRCNFHEKCITSILGFLKFVLGLILPVQKI